MDNKMHEKQKGNYAYWLLLGILAVLILSIAILSSVPPVSKDALVHHLAVPKLYLKHGGMYEIPFMPFSYYPMNLDLLYLIPLYFGNDIIPKFIHFSFALLTGWLLFRYLRRRINLRFALFGVIFFLSIPIIVKLSITVYVDLGVIFFSTASLLLLFEWIESRFKLRFLILSAVSCGLALGTKYNALVTFFLLTLFVPFIYARLDRGVRPSFMGSVKMALIFCFVSLIIFSPWMIRNAHWKKNPIYPLYDGWFNPQKIAAEGPDSDEDDRGGGLGLFTFRHAIYGEKGWEMALLPIRIFFEGEDGNPQYFDGRLNPFILLFTILAFFRLREDPQNIRNEKVICLAFAVLFFTFAFFSSPMRVRYISPILPPLVILSTMGVKKALDRVKAFKEPWTKGMGYGLILLFVGAALAYNAHYIWDQFRYVNPFNYLNGDLSRDDYISRYRPEYPAVKYINQHLPPDSLVLFLFIGNRGYYCDKNYRPGEDLLGPVFARSHSAADILRNLEDLGVTHLFVYFDLFNKWVDINLDEQKKSILNEFYIKHTRVLFNKNIFSVLNLEGPSS